MKTFVQDLTELKNYQYFLILIRKHIINGV